MVYLYLEKKILNKKRLFQFSFILPKRTSTSKEGVNRSINLKIKTRYSSISSLPSFSNANYKLGIESYLVLYFCNYNFFKILLFSVFILTYLYF